MSARSEAKPIVAVGQRLREARLQHGWTQDDLAQPEFTKSYVSAVERGRANPSLKALEVFARRLGLPVGYFVAAPVAPGQVDPAALDQDVAYQVDCARRAIDTGQADEAVRLLDDAAQAAGPHFAAISPLTRYRFYYARGAAQIRQGAPALARPDLETARGLAETLPEGADAVERVRNAIGATYYQQNLPHRALEYHTESLHAVQAGTVRDLNLRVQIYTNLANDYWAINDLDQAISIYKETLTLFDEVSNLDVQAGIYWGLSLAHKAKGDLAWARLYAARALAIYETLQNQAAIAQMQVNLAELLIARKEYAAATALLDQAHGFQEQAGNPVLLSPIYQQYAALALHAGDLPQAATHAERSLELIAAARAQTPDGDARTQANLLRAHIRALCVAGQVAERQDRPAEADARFAEALRLAEAAEAGEAAHELHMAYADLLAARGRHEDAARYYRVAAQHQVRPSVW